MPQYNARILFPLVPIFWLFMYWLSGYYGEVCFKSRLSEFWTTLTSTLFGTLILFFTIVIDDPVSDYTIFYTSYLLLFGMQFTFTYFTRLCITTITQKNMQKRRIGFNTLIIGVGEKAVKLQSDLDSMPKSLGFNIVGFASSNSDSKVCVDSKSVLGNINDVENLLLNYKITVVIIAIDRVSESEIYDLMHILCGKSVKIKLIPSRYELLTGSVKLTNIYGIPMVDLTEVVMPEWQKNVKRLTDIVISAIVLIVFSPVYAIIALKIFKKPIFKQERIGLHGKPFMMYKFRTMVIDAENGEALLSSKDDPRIIKIGHFLRKYRLDELPQFFNVLKGDMSLVGPRPEREYFINQIVKDAPYYYMLSNVRPGLTSWGMVKFGYAQTVEQMIERANYDVLYLENMSIIVDCKIAIYTIKTIITGKGI